MFDLSKPFSQDTSSERSTQIDRSSVICGLYHLCEYSARVPYVRVTSEFGVLPCQFNKVCSANRFRVKTLEFYTNISSVLVVVTPVDHIQTSTTSQKGLYSANVYTIWRIDIKLRDRIRSDSCFWRRIAGLYKDADMRLYNNVAEWGGLSECSYTRDS